MRVVCARAPRRACVVSGQSTERQIPDVHCLLIRDCISTPLSAAEEGGQEWPRPYLEPFQPKSRSIILQQIDIEETSEPRFGPVLRVFGVTEEGHSVLAHVRDFLPYFWVSAPRGFTNNDCKDFGIYLNVSVRTAAIAGWAILALKGSHALPLLLHEGRGCQGSIAGHPLHQHGKQALAVGIPRR